MASEIWQFLMVAVGFLIVALLWLFVVYLPGRTMECWDDQRPGRGDGEISSPAGSEGPSKRECSVLYTIKLEMRTNAVG